MEPIRSTDYFAAILYAPVAGFTEPLNKSGPIRRSSSAYAADLALVAMAVAAAIMVALLVINWPR
jgi:hypothetical protein